MNKCLVALSFLTFYSIAGYPQHSVDNFKGNSGIILLGNGKNGGESIAAPNNSGIITYGQSAGNNMIMNNSPGGMQSGGDVGVWSTDKHLIRGENIIMSVTKDYRKITIGAGYKVKNSTTNKDGSTTIEIEKIKP